MDIPDKKAFKTELRGKIVHHMGHFPFYFYGNIVINIVLAAIIIAAAYISIASLFIRSADLEVAYYGAFFIAGMSKVFQITFRNFLKNIRIISAISFGRYELEIEEYELDHVVDFIEQLPMKKEEVERVKVGLSYGKLVDLLDLIGIISCDDGMYDLDTSMKAKLMEEHELADEKAARLEEKIRQSEK